MPLLLLIPLIAPAVFTLWVRRHDRLGAGGWLGAWRSVSGEGFAASLAWMETGGIAGIGGVLNGYALAYTWGLRARL